MDAELTAAIEQLATAVSRLSRGGVEGPTGFEALVMALSAGGIDNHESLAQVLDDAGQTLANSQKEAAETVAQGLSEVAKNIGMLARATQAQADATAKLAGWAPALVAVLNPASKK